MLNVVTFKESNYVSFMFTSLLSRGQLLKQGLKLTVASGKLATWKSHLLPIEKAGSKKLLPGNSVVKVISGK